MAFRRELTTVAVLAATLLMLLPPAAMAEPQWLAGELVDPSGGTPDVTTDAEGNSAVVWLGAQGQVNAAVRPRGGPWGPAENLEPLGQVQTEDNPLIVAEPDGEFVAVWAGDYGGTSGNYVRWAHKPAGEAWSPPANIIQATSGSLGLSALEVGSGGDTTVLWTQGGGGAPYTNTKAAGSDAWGTGEPVPAFNDLLTLAMAPDGSAVVAYLSGCDETDCVRSVHRPPGGPWDASAQIVSQTDSSVTGIALTARPDSSYTAIWGEDAPAGRVASADRSPGTGGVWDAESTTVADLGTTAPGCPDPESGISCLDLTSRGDTLAAVWEQTDSPSAREIHASLRAGDGPWGASEFVGVADNGNARPQTALTADGTAVAVWSDGPAGTAVARVSHRDPDGTWSPVEIGTPEEGSAVFQDVVADDAGDAVTGWRDLDGMHTAGFDGAGPRFSSFSVPAAGTVGEALAFSAAAEDNWSSLNGISWLFSDGGTAPGGTVGHAYGTAGGFSATATATDGIGNASQRSGTTAVTAAPTPTPDPCGTADTDKDGIKDACDDNNGASRPVPFKTVNATVVSGDVFVKFPAGAARAAQGAKPPKGFVRLEGAATIPVGATLDTAKGRVRLRTASDTRNHVQTADFFRGRFVVRQVRKPRGKAKKRSTKLITDIILSGSSFRRTCRTTTASISQQRRRSKKRVRRLFGDGKGTFRTKGRNAAATVRGTRWSVQDRCDGTLVTVQRGRVSVRDLVKRKTVIVRTGRTYLARRR